MDKLSPLHWGHSYLVIIFTGNLYAIYLFVNRGICYSYPFVVSLVVIGYQEQQVHEIDVFLIFALVLQINLIPVVCIKEEDYKQFKVSLMEDDD